MPTTAHPAPQRRRAGLAALAFGVSAGPIAWIIHLVANYAIAIHVCFSGSASRASTPPSAGRVWALLLAIDLVAVAVAGAAALLSWHIWRSTRREFAGDAGELIEIGEGRTRFLALWGLLTGALSLLAIVFDLVALAVLRPC